MRGPSGLLGTRAVCTPSRSVAMSSLPDLPPPDESLGWLSDSTLERKAKRVKKTKEVKTQNKKKIVENVAGLPVLPLPDGVLSTGSSAKLEKGKQVER